VNRTARQQVRQRGFSLLELLVTLFVVVLITSMVTLNVNSGGQDILLEARVRNLAYVASYALDEAQMTGVDYGLLLEEVDVDGETVYTTSWRERYQEGWRSPDSGKEIFAREKLPPGLELQLALEDVPAVALSADEEENEAVPQVVLYASGETTAGSIDVLRRDSGDLLWRIQWDLLGRFEVLRRGEAREEL
jgi:general secretion pathway protein H